MGAPIPAVVAVHEGDQFAARSNDASGAPDRGATKGFRLPEVPQRGTLRGPAAGADPDPEPAVGVAGGDAGQHV